MRKANQTVSAFFWKLMERFGVQGAQFVLQIVLARLLDPDHYGVLAIMMVFVSLANVFIQTGFNTALIQGKDVDDDDYSSVFWVSLFIAGAIYGLIFIAAPWIGMFYNMPDLVNPLRVIALMLFPGAFNSIQLAKASRELNFKKIFVSNLGGIAVAGIVGIVIALQGGGLWALVAQSMTNVFTACLVMLFTVNWRPRFVLKFNRVKVLFAFGWKLLVAALIDTLYKDLQGLVVGKKYNSATLGFYHKGKQFPQFIIGAINGTVQSVMLPVMAKHQDSSDEVRSITRQTLQLGTYLIFPMMAGLAAISTQLVGLLLTDKWLPCVPYLQIYCFSYAFWPVHTSNLQAINALGRSDLFLKLEIIKKSYGLLAIIIAVVCFDSPIAIAATGIVTAFLGMFVNAWPNKKLLNYSFFDQMKDIFPSLLLSLIMFAGLVFLGRIITLPLILEIIILVVIGVVFYITMSVVFRLQTFTTMLNIVKGLLQKNPNT